MKIKDLLLVTGCLFLSSCLGYKTPPVNTREDLLKLDSSTTWIRGRGLSDDAILMLGRIENAEFLDLCGGYAVEPLALTDKGFKNLLSISDNLPNLNRLELCDCNSDVSDKAALYIAKISQLQHLSIMNCAGFTDKALEYLANSNSIGTIFLSRCDRISNEGFKCFDKNELIKRIRLENFSQSQINNIGLEYILAIPNLQSLSFANMPFLDNNSMKLFAESKQLKKLTFAVDCSLTGDDLEILSQSSTIEELAFSVNDSLDIEKLSVLQKLKTLRILHVHNVQKSDIPYLESIFKAMTLCEIVCTDKNGVYTYKYTPIHKN